MSGRAGALVRVFYGRQIAAEPDPCAIVRQLQNEPFDPPPSLTAICAWLIKNKYKKVISVNEEQKIIVQQHETRESPFENVCDDVSDWVEYEDDCREVYRQAFKLAVMKRLDLIPPEIELPRIHAFSDKHDPSDALEAFLACNKTKALLVNCPLEILPVGIYRRCPDSVWGREVEEKEDFYLAIKPMLFGFEVDTYEMDSRAAEAGVGGAPTEEQNDFFVKTIKGFGLAVLPTKKIKMQLEVVDLTIDDEDGNGTSPAPSSSSKKRKREDEDESEELKPLLMCVCSSNSYVECGC